MTSRIAREVVRKARKLAESRAQLALVESYGQLVE